MKVCTRCKQEKDESEFYVDGRNGNLRGSCKQCVCEINEIARSKRKLVHKEIPETKGCSMCGVIKDNYEFRKDHYSLDGLASCCRKCGSVLSNNWAKKNRDHVNKYLRIRYKNNRTHILEKNRKYESLPHVVERRKAYRHSEVGREVSRNKVERRRARMLELPHTLTIEQWEEILEQQNNTCNGCGREFSDELKPQQDHIFPLSKGGGYVKENIQALCKSCNSSKGVKLNWSKP